MDIYLYDANFQPVAIVDEYTSLIWRRKYYDVGDFELHCAPEHYPLFSISKYIIRNDAEQIGIIESISVNDTEAKATGRFAECLLSRCVISQQKDFDDKKQGEICNSLVTTFCPAVSVQSSSLGTTTDAQVTGDNLMDYTYKILQEAELSQKVWRDGNIWKYKVWQGLDRTQSQSANSRMVFSPDWDNLVSFSYDYSDKDFKNFAYVAGEGEGSARVIVEVDNTNGDEKRAVWIDARDLRKDDMTTAKYKEKLKQRGKEKLAEYSLTEKVTATVDLTASTYKVDYDLGDLCTITQPKYGLTVEKRIEQIDEVYENGGQSINITFGNGFLILTKYLKRELKG